MRDEDIFKRLKKETPLVKRKDIQPLPHKDFPPKHGTFDTLIERPDGKRDDRKSGYQASSGVYKKADSGIAKNTEQDNLSLYSEAARTETERVQRPQPRTIQARSETRIRTSPEPLERPAARAVSPHPQLKTREDSSDMVRPDSHPQIRAAVPQKQTQKPEAQPQLKIREKSAQESKPRAVAPQPKTAMLDESVEDILTVSKQSKPVQEAHQTRKRSIRDAYTPEKAAELDVFSDSPHRKKDRTRTGSATLVPMHMRRAEFEEYYEPVQAEDSVPAFRHELKYYINYAEYILLRNTLKALAQLDQYAGENGEYFIRSLYFDDEYESALNEKLGGSDYRKKYRIRIYNFDDNVIKFEKKIKQGQFITKKSLNLSRNEYEQIMAGQYAFLLRRKESLAPELYLELTGNRLRPRVIVDYIREAYVYPFENIRITFDKELRSGMWMSPDIFNPELPTIPMYEEGLMVLEVKFEKSLPAHILGVLNNIQAAQRSAISKYVICRKFE